jgi:translocation and assembly module TamB
MTQPNPDNHSDTRAKNRRLLILRRGGIAVGGLILIGLVGGVWRLWTFVSKDLAPLAQQSLTTTLNRPVKVGPVTGFSLSGVKFGTSSIPATPTDPEKATVDEVDAHFNILQLLFNRTLKLDVTLVNPNVYLEQDAQGRWFTTTFAQPGKAGPIKTELDYIRFRNGKATLVPRQHPLNTAPATSPAPLSYPLTLSQLNGTAQLLDNYQQINFDLTGLPGSGGKVAIKGDARPKTLDANLQVNAQNFLASDVTNLIKLPVVLQAGRVQSELNIKLKSWSPQLKTWQDTSINGNAVAQNVQLQIPRLPQSFNNSNGNLRFFGTTIQLENINTNYGTIPLVANGTVDTKAGLKLAATVKAVSLANAVQTLKLKPPVPVSGEAKADLQVVGSLTQPVLLGTVASTKPAKIDKIDISNFTSKFDLYTAASTINLKDIQAKPKAGGEITGTGQIKLTPTPGLNFNFVAKNVPGDAIASSYNIKTPFQIGNIQATASVTGPTNDAKTLVQVQAPNATYPTNGELTILTPQNQGILFRNVAFNVAGGKLQGYGSWANQNWQAVADAANLQVERFVNPQQLQNISLNDAKFNGRFILAGTTSPFTVSTIRPENAKVQVAGGTIAVTNLQLADGTFSLGLAANGIQPRLLLKQPLAVATGPLTGTFQIAGNTNGLSPSTVRGSGQATLAVGGGTVTASNIQLANGRYQAQVQANNLQLQQLANVPPQAQGRLTGQFNVAGSVTSFQPQTIQATGQARLNNIAGGTLTATNIQLASGQYQANVKATGVQLNQFAKQLQGQVGGNVQVAGTIGQQTLASLAENLRANGRVDFSRGLVNQQQPLTALVNWDGAKLTVQRATAPGLNANGSIAANFTNNKPEITDINLNVQAQNYNLQQLPIALPNSVALSGRADFNGQITGTLPLPNIQGQLALRNLEVNKLAFEPLLRGPVRSVPGQGVSVDLTGTRDEIAATLNTAYRPESFLVKWQNAIASGQTQGDNLAVTVNNFPLRALNLTPPPVTRLGPGPIAGLVNANLQVNETTFATDGSVAIAQPQVGRLKGDRLTAQFTYNNGKAELTSSELDKGNSRYNLAATVTQTAKGPRIQAKANVTSGQIRDVLSALQLYDLQDFSRGMSPPNYGTAADLKTTRIDVANQPIYDQIERYAEIEALVAEEKQQQRDSSYIPSLADLTGTFNAAISLDTATPRGLAADFNFNGINFFWGRPDEPNRYYKAQQVIVQGSLADGVLRLLPLRIESNQRIIAFTGNISTTEQSGQLQVTNFPLQILNNFVTLPVPVTGNLDGTATIAGSIKNPQARGELQVQNGTVNNKPVNSATASFSYNDGRLNFGSNLLVGSADPLTLIGSIPYKLPFASVAPTSNDLNLDINVKNQGLALLNLLTNQVAFENGQGQVNLTVRGTLQQPQVKGIATLNNATFSAQALPGKLTDVDGNVQFNLDQVNVENFQGNYNKGIIIAQGQIPIFKNSQTPITNPLTINLENLKVNFKTLYKGGVTGDLQLTGSAFNPIIGGQLELANGQVLLPTSTETNKSSISSISIAPPATPTTAQDKQNKPDTGNPNARLNNLELTLGKNVVISSPPIISFKATGTLDVNGPVTAPVPVGTIKLTGGGVNLFATQFNLARGYRQTATFRASQPRDPDLNVYLTTNVIDTGTTQVTNSPTSSEINDNEILTSFEPINTIRVDAKVNGPASNLNNNLQLTSSPSRSQAEIVALLGGSFIQELGLNGGNNTLGLVSLAGSALNLQQTFTNIGHSLGLSEFRLFPTFSTNSINAKRHASASSGTNPGLDVAAEAGVDISRGFYATVLKVLTTNQPTQFGVSYRVTPELRIRTSTDFTEDTNAQVEYQMRF